MNKHDLLHKLTAIRTAERGIAPDPTWVLHTRERLMSDAHVALKAAPVRTQRKTSRFVPSQLFALVRAPAMAVFSIVTVLGGSLVGVSASERSIPGDFLYPIKLASEQTRLALTSDNSERIKLKTEYVDRRVAEIKTIAANPDGQSSQLLKETAKVLKRDLDTVKNQLKEVKKETATKAAAVAKLVDQKSEAVAHELKQVKESVPQDVKSSVSEAETAAVHTGVTAVEVLIGANQSPGGQDVISDAEITDAIQHKVQGIQASLDGTAERLRAASASGTISDQSTTTLAMIASSTTLQEVRDLLGDNNLAQVTFKLNEAAKTAGQAEIAVDLATSSSSTSAMPATTNGQASSTSSAPAASTSTASTTSSTTASPP